MTRTARPHTSTPPGPAPRPAPRPGRAVTLAALACAAALALTACEGAGAEESKGANRAAPPVSDPEAPMPSSWPTETPTASPEPGSTPEASPAGSATPAPPAGVAGVPTGAGVLTGRTVLLDPGHNPANGKHATEINRKVDIGNARKECDTTGTTTNAGYSEAAYTLDVSRRAREILTARGAKVLFTQDDDRAFGPCIDERARIGNEGKADAAVSVHGDGAGGADSGFHVIMPAKVKAGKADTTAIVEPSHRLGLLLRDHFKAATDEPYADYIGEQGLDTRSDLGGLNLSKVPKVFIECGNMRNTGDAGRMTDPQWRQRAAQGIADAVTAFLTTPAAGPSKS
ncbi:N-acetylmuramoyl-L-alanine amidase [Kitasatospora sp. NPDC096147]|uniref:N-acetylmuramoyl-L-alanine amidase n=1 Tax=Kitasatospora sp. NPDC096147 TaxID=3364093 RepID=UPI0037FAB4E3